MIAASRRAESETRGAASLGVVLVCLRSEESGGRASFWDGGNGPSGGLTDGAARGLGSGGARGARMAVEGVL